MGFCTPRRTIMDSKKNKPSVPFSIPTPHVASLTSKCCHIHGSRASRLRPDTPSAAYSRTLTRAHAGATRSARRGPYRALRKVMVRTITKRTRWLSAPMMKIITEADPEAGRRCGAPCQEPFSKRQQQHLSPPSPDDRAPRGRLAGLVAKGTPKTTAALPSSSSPMSFKERNKKWLP